MSTLISAGTSTSGAVINSDTSGSLQLQTGSTPTTAVTIDTAQNVGVGVTPSAWRTTTRATQIGYAGSLAASTASTTTNNVYLGSNWYINSTPADTYINNGYATLYQQQSGIHYWSIAPSGTAGNAITFTTAMTLDNSGHLLVGLTSAADSAAFLQIGGTSGTMRILPGTDNTGYVGQASLRWAAIYAANGTIQTSDGRQKNSVQDSNLGLSFIQSLRPVSFKWNVGENVVTTDEEGKQVITPRPGKRTHYGFIAQEVKTALGEQDFGGYVEEEDGQLGLRYDQFISPLVKAIQELSAKVTALEAKVGA